jgi:hypothetical protein
LGKVIGRTEARCWDARILGRCGKILVDGVWAAAEIVCTISFASNVVARIEMPVAEVYDIDILSRCFWWYAGVCWLAIEVEVFLDPNRLRAWADIPVVEAVGLEVAGGITHLGEELGLVCASASAARGVWDGEVLGAAELSAAADGVDGLLNGGCDIAAGGVSAGSVDLADLHLDEKVCIVLDWEGDCGLVYYLGARHTLCAIVLADRGAIGDREEALEVGILGDRRAEGVRGVA